MPKTLGAKTLENQAIVNDYMAFSGADEIDMRKVAEWAISTGRWTPPHRDPVKECQSELSRAARQEYFTDPQNREVRKKHCIIVVEASGQKRWHWLDIESAPPDKMHLALQTRRQAAFRDVVQIETDLCSYNDNNTYGAQLLMSFNFDEDLAELKQDSEYPDSPTEE